MKELTGKTLLERYHVEEHLGRGGMAEVYLVYDQLRATQLAIKVLREEMAEDRIFLRRFKREADTLAQLQHPHIVRLYGLEQENTLAFMLMDYVDGITLRTEIFNANAPLPTNRILEIIRPICSALHYSHAQNLIHCDIKPANVMVHKNGTILLTDFGIARVTEAVTATMAGAGTPAYMPPEQIHGDDPTPEMDIYALGVVLYEMVTGGERPYTGERADTTGSTMHRVIWEKINLDPPSPKEYNPALSDELEAIIIKCLRLNPEKRYHSALELLAALEEAISGDEAASAEELKAAFQAESIKQQMQKEKDRPKRKWLAYVVGLIIVLVAGFGAVNLLGGGGIAPVQPTAVPTETAAPTAKLPTQTEEPTPTPLPEPTATLPPTEVDAAEPTKIIPTSTPVPQTATPAPTPLGGGVGQIAFASDRNGGTPQIWFINLDGSGLRPLTAKAGGACQPSWAPDGTKLVFISPCNTEKDSYPGSTLYIIQADRTGLQVLPIEEGYTPAWSHTDENLIAYTAPDAQSRPQIFIFNLADSTTTQVTDSDLSMEPAWSPDGTRLVFSSNRSGSFQIWSAGVDGSFPLRYTKHDAADHRDPTWSLDGQLVLFTELGGLAELVVIPILDDGFQAGEAYKVLQNSRTPMKEAKYSPDGQWLVFQSWPNNHDIYYMPADGSANPIGITDDAAFDFDAAWRP